MSAESWTLAAENYHPACKLLTSVAAMKCRESDPNRKTCRVAARLVAPFSAAWSGRPAVLWINQINPHDQGSFWRRVRGTQLPPKVDGRSKPPAPGPHQAPALAVSWTPLNLCLEAGSKPPWISLRCQVGQRLGECGVQRLVRQEKGTWSWPMCVLLFCVLYSQTLRSQPLVPENP